MRPTVARWAFLIGLGFMLVGAPRAFAGLHEKYSFSNTLYTVCNHTPWEVDIAFGWTTRNDMISVGWWSLAPGACQGAFPTDSIERGYYATATDENGDTITWSDRDSPGYGCINTQYAFVYRESDGDQDLCGGEDDDDWVAFRRFPDSDLSLTRPDNNLSQAP